MIFKISLLMFVLSNSLFAQQSIPEGSDIVPAQLAPDSSYITVKYSTKENGQLKMYASNLNTLAQYGIIRNTIENIGDNQQFTLDISNWQSGINSLIFEYNGDLIIENIIKN